jgi:hypothetical protein
MKRDQGMVRKEFMLARNVPFIGVSGASVVATWLTLSLARFCMVVTGAELAPQLGEGLVAGV